VANAPANPVDTGASPPITILPTSQYIAIATQDAINVGISPTYFVNQINAESSFNPNAISPAGAVGIAQFLPSTAAGLGINPYDPIQALRGAALHMADLNRSYAGNYAKALAAYNAGSGAVNYAVQQGGANWMNFVPYETQQYIYKIMGV
jgi:soluble lytic murein transglycosylase-like protein